MQKVFFAVACLTAIVFVGVDSNQATARSPFVVQVGGPGGITISSGRRFSGYYNRRPAPPYGVTTGFSHRHYSAYGAPHGHYGYYPPARRSCDYGYGYGRGYYGY